MPDSLTQIARELRQRQTKAESLLWNVLRAKRLNGLKFRRQHPIEPFVADFACCELRLVVEIDGGYHDYQCEDDAGRSRYLQNKGWRVIRFPNEDVNADVEAVAIAIARLAGFQTDIDTRVLRPSGMMCPRPKKQ